MSLKIDKFNNEIMPLWNQIQNVVNEIDETLVPNSHIKNLAYLRKIIAFLSQAMSCIDADFLPRAFLDEIQLYLSDIKSYLVDTQGYTNSSYIRLIEDSLDRLLQIVFPFILHKGGTIKGLKMGLNEYSKTINAHVENEFSEIKSIRESANKIKAELKNELDKLEALRTEIEEYRDLIFSADGVKESIENLFNRSHSKLFEIEELHNSIYELKEDSSATLQELSNFYDKIFGKDDENGKKVDGLKQEIDQRRSDLDDFKQKQQERYNELNKQIENLLPGATSAGLSSAYSEMRSKFGKTAKWYGCGFYLSLCILLGTVVGIKDVILVRDIPLDKGIWISLLVLLGNFFVKMPFIIPALWLVIFISRRRSEVERLSQEYAHKEVLAKSYDSYKQQIEKLPKEDQEKLLPVLMEGMIRAISLNPAETLDQKHQSDSPISEILKDKSFIDSIVDKIKSSSSKS